MSRPPVLQMEANGRFSVVCVEDRLAIQVLVHGAPLHQHIAFSNDAAVNVQIATKIGTSFMVSDARIGSVITEHLCEGRGDTRRA